MKLTTALIALLAMVGATNVTAGTFGGAEYGYTNNDNFNGATGATPKLEENIGTSTLYLGNFKPLADKRSAIIFKGSIQINSLETATQLDNTTYRLDFGYYKKMSTRNSMTTTFSARAKRFDDSRRDGEVYSIKASFKQKSSSKFWYSEGIIIEHGEADVNSGVYNGIGINGSINTKLSAGTVMKFGASWLRRVYDVTTADVRTGKTLSLGAVHKFNKKLYIRASVAHQNNETNAGTSYDSTILSTGIGLSF